MGLILLLSFLSAGYGRAAVYRIPEGTDGIAQAARSAASGDTLLLTSFGGRYNETDQVALPAVPLTIMADSTLSDKPVWTTDGTRHLRVYADITVKGIVFDGRRNTQYAIRNYAQPPNRIAVENCVFQNIVRDAVTDVPVAACEIRNTVFQDIGASAIEFRTEDMCPALTVENCTFDDIGELAIIINEDRVPARVRISNVTIYNALGGIYLNTITDAQVQNSIISKCRIYGIRALSPAVLTKICTYDNWEDYDLVTPGENCF